MPIPNNIQSPEFSSYLRRLTEPHVGMLLVYRTSSQRILMLRIAAELKKLIASELKEWNDLHREPNEVARYLPVELPIIIQAL